MTKGHTIEAYGVRGMKSSPWRKTFKSGEHLHEWAEKHDAEVHAQRDLEGTDYEKKAAAAFYANKPMDEVQAHLNRGWTAHEEKMAKTDNGKGFKSLKHKSEATSGKDTYHREDGYPSTEKLR